jgi:hypothetical protein
MINVEAIHFVENGHPIKYRLRYRKLKNKKKKGVWVRYFLGQSVLPFQAAPVVLDGSNSGPVEGFLFRSLQKF